MLGALVNAKLIKKFLYIVGLLFVVSFASFFGKVLSKATYNSLKETTPVVEVEAKLIAEAESLNKQLPIMIDKETRLDVVLIHGKQIHYKCTLVNFSGKSFDNEQFLKNVKESIVKSQKNDTGIMNSLRKDVSYHYRYFDNDNVLIGVINIDRNDHEI